LDTAYLYTDGSKDGARVASVDVFGQQVASLRLPFASSIFSAEANAILLALKFIASSDKKVNAWSVQILFLACWQLRVVKLKILPF
jgi:hypothetical protein